MKTIFTSDAAERGTLETLVAQFNLLVADVQALRAHYAAHSTSAPVGVPAATTDTLKLLK